MVAFFATRGNRMLRVLLTLICLLGTACKGIGQETTLPAFEYEVAHAHELKPHRRTIPLKGVNGGFNQFHISLTVAPSGGVVKAEVSRNDELIKFWPKI